MANFYSQHYTATTSGTSIDSPPVKVDTGIDHASIRYKTGVVTTTSALSANDVLRFFRLKSADRILEIMLSHAAEGGGSTITADLGVHASPDGLAVDANLFSFSPFDADTNIARTDQFVNGSLDRTDRGKPLWQLLGLSSDTKVTYDITMTIASAASVQGSEYQVECYYTSE